MTTKHIPNRMTGAFVSVTTTANAQAPLPSWQDGGTVISRKNDWRPIFACAP
jgi:hypothetical protein